MSRQGFILQASMRLQAGQPVLLFYGRLVDGETFLVRETRQRACFFVRVEDIATVARLAGAAATVRSVPYKTLSGEAVSRVELLTPVAAASLSHRLRAEGVQTYEADLNMVARCLLDRRIFGSVNVSGPAQKGRPIEDGVDLVFENPVLSPGVGVPTLKPVCIRALQGPDGTLRAVTLADAQGVVLLHQEADVPEGIRFSDERSLLSAFIKRLWEKDPDVLLGWNLFVEDLPLLRESARRCRMSLPLSRGPGELQFQGGTGRNQPPRAVLSGRVVLDLASLFRLSEGRSSDDVLVEREEEDLEEKTAHDLPDQRGALLRLGRETERMFSLLTQQGLLNLAVERSRLTGLPLDRAAAHVSAFDTLCLVELHERGFVANTFERQLESNEPPFFEPVLETKPGLYSNVWVFDVRGLAASILTMIEAGHESSQRGGDVRFGVQTVVARSLAQRFVRHCAHTKQAAGQAQTRAIHLSANTLYGVLMSKASRFHEPKLASEVTRIGRSLLVFLKERLEHHGHRVLRGDFDAVFVLSNLDDKTEKQEIDHLGHDWAERLSVEISRHLANIGSIEKTVCLESPVHLTFHSAYRRLFLYKTRGKDKVSGKRYAGLPHLGSESRIEFVGLEAARRDSTPFCKTLSRNLHNMLFAEAKPEHVAAYVKDTVAQLFSGVLDDSLVCRRKLRRELSEYASTNTPHVTVAARHNIAPGNLVPFVMTESGPEHPAHRQHPIDYDHYVEKQLRPIAEPIFFHLGLAFRGIADQTERDVRET